MDATSRKQFWMTLIGVFVLTFVSSLLSNWLFPHHQLLGFVAVYGALLSLPTIIERFFSKKTNK